MKEALFWFVVVIVIILLPLAVASMIVERHGDFLRPPRKSRIKRNF